MDYKRTCPLCRDDLFFGDEAIQCENQHCNFQGPMGMNEEDAWKNWHCLLDIISDNALAEAGHQLSHNELAHYVEATYPHNHSFFFNIEDEAIKFFIPTVSEKLTISVKHWMEEIAPIFEERIYSELRKKIRAIKEFRSYAYGLELLPPGLLSAKSIITEHKHITQAIENKRAIDSVPALKIGLCVKCEYRIEGETEQHGKVKVVPMIGCRLTKNPMGGNNCPLTQVT